MENWVIFDDMSIVTAVPMRYPECIVMGYLKSTPKGQVSLNIEATNQVVLNRRNFLCDQRPSRPRQAPKRLRPDGALARGRGQGRAESGGAAAGAQQIDGGHRAGAAMDGDVW